VQTHKEVFGWVLGLLADRGLLKGKRVGVDATTLEASAAICSIVRRDTGESYNEFLAGLAKASSIPTPTREQLARLDRKRKKRTSNKEWMSPTDADARVTKMKDGRTYLAHKAEHAVDLDTGAVVAVALREADQGDTTTVDRTLREAGERVAELVGREAILHPDAQPQVNVRGIEEVVADKGYHSGAVLERVAKPSAKLYSGAAAEGAAPVGEQGRPAAGGVRQRKAGPGQLRQEPAATGGEFVERSFAHCYDTGMRRTHLRKHNNIFKRQLIHVAGFNLSLIFRRLFGAGSPREWHNLGRMPFCSCWACLPVEASSTAAAEQ
jgi:transposase